MNSQQTAAAIVDEWERLEGESMREGHRTTLENLITTALDSWRARGFSAGLSTAIAAIREKS
jgi:hypothetical protein